MMHNEIIWQDFSRREDMVARVHELFSKGKNRVVVVMLLNTFVVVPYKNTVQASEAAKALMRSMRRQGAVLSCSPDGLPWFAYIAWTNGKFDEPSEITTVGVAPTTDDILRFAVKTGQSVRATKRLGLVDVVDED